MSNILVCDDEQNICTMLEIALRRHGNKVETVASGEAAKRRIDCALYDAIITDIKMPGVDGIEVLRHAHRVSPHSAVILITAFDDNEALISAGEAGGFFAYVRKTPNLAEDVVFAVSRGLEKVASDRQTFALKRDAASRNSLDNIVGASAAMAELKETIRAVASTSSTVLVRGESGTGKELVARALHGCSSRAGDAFVSVNCGAFPEALLESELFGHVKGAFTGAYQNKRGLFEVANGGTIFLDEISEMSLAMQVKLLRVLQERVCRPVGGTGETSIDVRVIAATNKDLDRMVGEGTFREDLYYRLNVIPIVVPPLRERVEDIPLLANHFLKKYAPSAGKRIVGIANESLERLCCYEWPGNVRQLENMVERSVALCRTEELTIDLPEERAKQGNGASNGNGMLASTNGKFALPEAFDMERHIASLERSILKAALEKSDDVQTRAATLLNLSYRSFRHLLKKYDL